MKRIVAAGLLCLALTLWFAAATRADLWQNHPTALCYAFDDTEVVTMLGGRTSPELSPYPIEVSGSVEQQERFVRVVHVSVWERLRRHTYVPVVAQ